jgi:hypothetical protein
MRRPILIGVAIGSSAESAACLTQLTPCTVQSPDWGVHSTTATGGS